MQVAAVQAAERARQAQAANHKPLIRIAIITARSAPADHCVMASRRECGVTVDEGSLIGDRPTYKVLSVFRPHLFFDDKPKNARLAAETALSVHVPFGVTNR